MKLRFATVVASVATVVLSAGLVLSASPAVAAGSDPKPIPGGFVPFPGAPFIHVFTSAEGDPRMAEGGKEETGWFSSGAQ